MIADARTGLGILADGMRFLRRERSLWPLAATPALLATISVCAALVAVWSNADSIHSYIVAWLPAVEAGAWYTWLWVGPARLLLFAAHWALFFAASAVAVAIAFLVANVAAAPFLERLSQRVEELEEGTPVADSGRSVWVDVRHTVVNELRRLSFFAGVWFAIALLGLVPVIQLIAPPLGIAFTVLFLPLEYGGNALDRRLVDFRTRRLWVRRHLPLMAGFGGAAFLTFLVPLLNFVMIPTLVVAGTLLVLRHPPDDEGDSDRQAEQAHRNEV